MLKRPSAQFIEAVSAQKTLLVRVMLPYLATLHAVVRKMSLFFLSRRDGLKSGVVTGNQNRVSRGCRLAPDTVVMRLKCSFMKEVNNYCLESPAGKIRDNRACDKSTDANSTPECRQRLAGSVNQQSTKLLNLLFLSVTILWQ